jgi:hypothetical protein
MKLVEIPNPAGVAFAFAIECSPRRAGAGDDLRPAADPPR